MKKIILLFFLMLFSNIFTQNTFIPDDNFEQSLIDMGLDSGPLDDFVLTSNISSLLEIFIMNSNISDLTGIEDFTALEHLQIDNNNITNLDISKLSRLRTLVANNNTISNLDISENLLLENLFLDNNFLNDLDISENLLLANVSLVNNTISSLDFKNHKNLSIVELDNNNLISLDLRNQENENINIFSTENNPNLQCIFVDNINYSVNNWVSIDATSFFVENERQCKNVLCNIIVDSFSDVTNCDSYILPTLINGNFYTESNGNGMQLNAGDIITNSQKIYIYNVDPLDPLCFKESSFQIDICNFSSQKDNFFPSFFTPNDDGINDFWIVKSTKEIKSIYIFDRFGKILSSPNPAVGWNGIFKGKKMISNTYWYQIIFHDNSFKKGHFSLLRN